MTKRYVTNQAGPLENIALFVFYRVDKKRDKLERKVLDSQERAFWDVHRPVVSNSFVLLLIAS